jgi:hypothetical protein
MTAVSSSANEYVPSAYLAFDKAVALGQAHAPAPKAESIVEVAQACKNSKGQSSGHVIVQHLNGNFVEDSQ